MIERYAIWTNLKQNKTAVTAACFIVLCILLGIFCYPLATDSTQNANVQTVEIQAKPPGYKQLYLVIPDTADVARSYMADFFTGKRNTDKFIPVNKVSLNDSTWLIDKYVDEAVSENIRITFNKKKSRQPYILNRTFILGTDLLGRDIYSRLLIGIRTSLAVGFTGVIISMCIGILLGALAGYFQGRTDQIISWFINVSWSIPTVLLVFALTMITGKGFWQILIAIGLTMWVNIARIVRGQVLSIQTQDFVTAAKGMGAAPLRIIIKHILPNIRGPLLVLAANNFATAIMLEAGLSFLGIGVQPPVPGWGLMMRENYTFLLTSQPFLAIIPGLAIMLLVLAFYMLGNGLRDASDARLN